MKNRLEQFKSEIFELKKKLAEKEAEYLDLGKEILNKIQDGNLVKPFLQIKMAG